MIKIKKLSKDNTNGISLILFWILSLSCSYTSKRGEHMHFGIGLGPLETFVGFSIWSKWKP